MTDAPEQIWVAPDMSNGVPDWNDGGDWCWPNEGLPHETAYIRADIHQAAITAAHAAGIAEGMERAAGMAEADGKVTLDASKDADLPEWAVSQMEALAGHIDFFAHNIRAAIPKAGA